MNPLGFAYSSLEGVDAFAKPGAVIVTGRGNRMDDAFQAARRKGVELWAYWNCKELPNNLKNPQDQFQFLLPNGALPPVWPYKDKNGRDRESGYNAKLLDIRPGSAWLKHIIPRTGELIELHKHDGLMLDTMGTRPWSKTKTVNGVVVPGADWDTWSVEEQELWTKSAVNLAREIAAEARRHTPMVKLVHNNLWANVLPKTHPAYAIAPEGEKYCNGVMLENTSGDLPSDFHKAYAGRTFGLLPRRVPVVDTTDADALAWSKVPGVTHVCSVEKAVGETYAKITPAIVAYDGPDAPPPDDEVAKLRAQVIELTAQSAANAKLASDATARADKTQIEVERLKSKLSKIDAELHA